MLKIAPLLALIVFLSAVAASIHAEESQTDDLADAHAKITRYMQAQSDAILTHSSPQRQQPDIADELPVFMSFVNRTSNELVIGLDRNATGTAEQYMEKIRQITNGSAIPVRLVSGHFVEESCDAVNDRCDPLIGGIEISRNVPITVLDLPVGPITIPVVNNNGDLGFVMSGHVAGTRLNVGIFQPNENHLNHIGVGNVITNPTNARSSDSAFVRTLDNIALEQKIFNPDGDPFNVVGTRTSEVHDIVRMAGIINKTIGDKNYTTTSGGVTSTGVTIYSPTYGTLTDQNTAGYRSAKGDSGAPVYSIGSGDGVLLHGIHVGKSCFSDFPPTIHSPDCKYVFPVYSPWEHVRSELNLKPVTGSLEAPTSLFESFDDLDVWTEEGETGWSTGSPDEGGHPPGHNAATNTVAKADDCDSECRLVLSDGLDLTGYDSAAMTLYRYVDDDLDGGEYLEVDVSTNGGTSWINAYDWQGNRDDDDTWTKHMFDLADHLHSSNFKVRLAVKTSSSSEDVMVDSLSISGLGTSTPAIFRNGIWYVNNGFDGIPEQTFGYGMAGDLAVAGDWDGDGIDTPAIFRNGIWYVNNGFDGIPEQTFGYGMAGDLAVAGDWDGDGIDTPAIFRNGIWYVNNGFDGIPEQTFGYGMAGDLAVAGDWDGDGIDTPAIFRNGIWYVNNGFDGIPEQTFGYGMAGDLAVAGDWDGDGIDTPAIFRNGIWYVNNGFDGIPEQTFGYGMAGDLAVAGDWDGR